MIYMLIMNLLVHFFLLDTCSFYESCSIKCKEIYILVVVGLLNFIYIKNFQLLDLLFVLSSSKVLSFS